MNHSSLLEDRQATPGKIWLYLDKIEAMRRTVSNKLDASEQCIIHKENTHMDVDVFLVGEKGLEPL